ncbi:MAG TPA: transglycosylase SLT domain-containing protein, partial [bacterium]|nr:transglycosylase SLT domain-containing protein [bacterium]
MKRLLSMLALVFSFGLFANDVCEQVHNWEKLSSLQQTKASSLVYSIFKLEQNILDEFKIPLNTTYYSTDLNVKYIGEYPNSKNASVIVGYVPLQFVEYYEDELQKFYDKKDDLNVVPRLDVILAIHYTESNFIPTALGGRKDNPAFGMMQLTINTAEDLYRRDKEEYKKYFSIENKKVVFNSTKSQVSLTIKFLTDIKKYTREYETAAVTRYNGVGDDAKAYASLVLSRARLYKKLRSGG